MKKTNSLKLILGLSLSMTLGTFMGTLITENTEHHLAVASGPAIEPTSSPDASLAPSESAVASPSTTPTSTPDPDTLPGWHGSGKKKFYVLKDGTKATGYKKIKGAYYYFKKSGYAVTSSWRNVKIYGKKYRIYFTKSGKRKMDLSKLLDKKTGVTYKIETNLTTNSVMIYAKWKTKKYMIPVRRMRCSVGKPGHETITGTYRLSKTGSRWHVLRYGCYGQYCSRISGPYLFHSVVYKNYGNRYSLDLKEYNKLGKSASHGCIRLQVEDAKWIYNHTGLSTARLYRGKKEKLPIPYPAKKKAGKTKSGKYYDPTDVD